MKLLGIKPVDMEIQTLLDEVKLMRQQDVMIKHLSAGGKRKLSIALALIGDPVLLIFDEPTANLDLKSREKIWDILSSLV